MTHLEDKVETARLEALKDLGVPLPEMGQPEFSQKPPRATKKQLRAERDAALLRVEDWKIRAGDAQTVVDAAREVVTLPAQYRRIPNLRAALAHYDSVSPRSHP